MPEWMTAQNMTLFLTAFLTLWQMGKSALRTIAPLTTGTTADDKALAAMESAEKKLEQIEQNEWVKAYGPGFWLQVEALSKTQIPALKGVSKLALFLGMAHQAWAASHQTGLGAGSVTQLEHMAASMSAEEKLANPRPAPGSN